MTLAQDTAQAGTAKPTEHILGTVTATDKAAHTITVKEDKTGTEYVVSVGNTRTLLRVQPGAKDLKSAVRITADDFAAGDRVDVRAIKGAEATGVDARSVVLMSARDLEQHHEAQLQAWQNSTVGSVLTVNPTGNSISIASRTPEGRKTITVQITPQTQFTRYSPANPKTAAPSQVSDIQAGDQLHIIGEKSPDGDSITATNIYSAPTRTVAATITSIDPSGKQLVVRDLQNKQQVTVSLADDSSIRKLPEQMAAMMAARFNGGGANGSAGAHAGQNGGQGSGGAGGSHQWSGNGAGGGPAGEGATPTAGSGNGGPSGGGPGAGQAGMHRRGADLSRMLQTLPQITVSELKPGQAVVIWGMAGNDPNSVTANIVLAGVEPVLQAAAPREGQSLNRDWGLDMAVPE